MALDKPNHYGLVVLVILLWLMLVDCHAQQERQDHSCTFDVAGAFATPKGEDGNNFDKGGWGVQAGGGFAISLPKESDRGNSYFITANFMFEKFKATAAALALAKESNPTQLANATSAHGAFTTVTLDPTVRHSFGRRFNIYGLGGFGWMRRGVGFNGANPATLLQSNGVSLDRLDSDSGVFDFGAGANFAPRKLGGFMLFVEGRVYRGLAVNGGSTLLPLSLGVRW
jgi:hypothetical protein